MEKTRDNEKALTKRAFFIHASLCSNTLPTIVSAIVKVRHSSESTSITGRNLKWKLNVLDQCAHVLVRNYQQQIVLCALLAQEPAQRIAVSVLVPSHWHKNHFAYRGCESDGRSLPTHAYVCQHKASIHNFGSACNHQLLGCAMVFVWVAVNQM